MCKVSASSHPLKEPQLDNEVKAYGGYWQGKDGLIETLSSQDPPRFYKRI